MDDKQDLWLTWLENAAQVSRKTGAGVPIPEHHFSVLYTKRLVNPPALHQRDDYTRRVEVSRRYQTCRREREEIRQWQNQAQSGVEEKAQ